MSEPDNRQAPFPVPPDAPSSRHLSRRGWTVLLSVLLVAVFGAVGAIVTVPFVALGPGPTYDTLGAAADGPVIKIDGEKTYPTSGELMMTTVALTDDLTLFGALGLWVSGRYALEAREVYFPPGESDEDVKKENVQQFRDSQSNAVVAALRGLGYPVKVLAKEIVSGSPADEVLSAGDELLVVNGQKITQAEDVRQALRGTRPGESISLTFQQDGRSERTESIILAKRDDRPEGFIGLQPIDRADVSFSIDITLEDVGGPSAGLMFALAIVDRLTPGELAAGGTIAGTGEISERGVVGPIGGISFKLVAAKEAGADVFLVPADNCAEAAASAPDGLRLVKVGTLDDAITALEKIDAGDRAPSC
ncbi:MAG: YlbL family protein [Haloechinothrix sp.]